jgi:hypothetical protein
MQALKAVAFAACVLFAMPAMAQEARGTVLNINAEGTSEARPDMATLRLGVVTTGRTAQAALEDNAQRMTGLIDALRREGLAERDIQTVSVSVYPNRQQRIIANYRAVNAVNVRIRDIAAVGRVVDAVVGAGGNTIEGLVFSFQDPAAQRDLARRAAIAEARRRADLYAQGLGLRVVRAIEVSEPGAVRQGSEQLELTATLTTDSLMNETPSLPILPIVPGEITTQASVSISFELR